ncbi:MAG: nicotinate (nicotinamide) nucleotide adenylyltransferase [Acidobacteria bacterium]|nr:nicotinate (nicotinamide) nucleotide adenylyltransferase [Acidobacteriota bacterium]
MKRVAYFGGTFDPVHCGHIAVAKALVPAFGLDRLHFLPAFHAPHKPERRPTSGYHRYAMLSIATANEPMLMVSTLELDKRERRYTIDTLAELKALHADSELFFVMGADSWTDIRTWKDWESVLLAVNHIVVSRPGFELSSDHVTPKVQSRIVDLRTSGNALPADFAADEPRIFITDAVNQDISATDLREDLSDGELDRQDEIPAEVAKYIEKYELYR